MWYPYENELNWHLQKGKYFEVDNIKDTIFGPKETWRDTIIYSIVVVIATVILIWSHLTKFNLINLFISLENYNTDWDLSHLCQWEANSNNTSWSFIILSQIHHLLHQVYWKANLSSQALSLSFEHAPSLSYWCHLLRNFGLSLVPTHDITRRSHHAPL